MKRKMIFKTLHSHGLTWLFNDRVARKTEEPRLLVGWWNMLNSALWFWQARMNNTTGCCGSSAPGTKDWAKTVCYKITSNRRTHGWDCVMNKFDICYILICSFPQSDWKQTSATAARLSKMNMQTSFKSFTRVCINTKPSVSQRAKANALAYRFQSNYLPYYLNMSHTNHSHVGDTS